MSKRYLVLEIPEEGNPGLHDVEGLIETMRTSPPEGNAVLKANGLVMAVKIPRKFDAQLVGTDKLTGMDIYTVQEA